MVAYWQQEVIPHHLPRIGKKQKLQSELQARATVKNRLRGNLKQPDVPKASPPVVPRFKSLQEQQPVGAHAQNYATISGRTEPQMPHLAIQQNDLGFYR